MPLMRCSRFHNLALTYLCSPLPFHYSLLSPRACEEERHDYAARSCPAPILSFLEMPRMRMATAVASHDAYEGIVSKSVRKPADRLTLFQDSSRCQVAGKQRDDKYLESFDSIGQNVKSVNLRLGSVRRSHRPYILRFNLRCPLRNVPHGGMYEDRNILCSSPYWEA